MRAIGLGDGRRARRSATTELRGETASSGELAWIGLLPCALLTVLVVLLLGGPLGRAFLGPGSELFWPLQPRRVEPEEHGQYLLSLLGPVLLTGLVLVGARGAERIATATARRWALIAQWALVAFAVVCFAAQYDVVVSAERPEYDQASQRFFTPPTLIAALLLPLALIALMRRPGVPERVAALVRETRARRIGALVVAVLFTALWLLTAVNADGSLANTASGVAGHLLWSMDETFAILNGRTPLVDFHSQYAQLWPYLLAGVMSVAGTSIGVYTTLMVLGSGLVLLAVYAVLRRVTRSSLLTLVLFLPLVATGFFVKIGPLDDRYGPANLFSLWPVRYGGPYLLLWLLARQLGGDAPRRTWVLGLAAGVAILNNPEFGVAGVAATAVGLLAARPPRSWQAAGRLALQALAGLAGAVALVALGTLLRSGSLPDFSLLSEFTRLYGVGGWALIPMPDIGIFLVVYVTFGAALVLAGVRFARGEADTLLTALLAWIGVFGLIAGGYFAGRSHPQVLIDLFSPWALALALLAIAVVRDLAARDWRRPSPAQVAVLFGVGLTVCSLPQTPTPWGQIARITDEAPRAIFKLAEAAAFVERTSRPGEKVAILIPLGHRIAYDTGRVNVSPYSSSEAMPTHQQLQTTLAALRAEGAHKIYISARFTLQELGDAILGSGFEIRDEAVGYRDQYILIGDRP